MNRISNGSRSPNVASEVDSSRNLLPTDIWFNGATANRYRVNPINKKMYIR